ncbi:MAG: sulfate ABC transporter substrate-binding protein [Actinomycetota bacterium]
MAVVLLALVLAACGGGGGNGDAGPAADGAGLPAAELTLVAYSTPQEAYDEIIEAFRDTPAGRNITFTKSYGASGEQSRAVASGLAADVVAFSLEPDMTRLVKAGLVAGDWAAGEHEGMVTDSLAVFVVRKGNPKGIETWADLVEDGVEVITPNPFTSGGARWNVMAAYGQASRVGTAHDDGVAYLHDLFGNVPVQDDTARKSLQTFTSGKGDVLLAYENEAIFAQQKGQAIDYVVPDDTILIENPVAVTSSSKHPEQARAFVEFLYGAKAQGIFAANGYRPVVAGVDGAREFEQPSGVFDIEKLGGWAEVTRRFFDPAAGVMAEVERKIGVSVG